MLHKLSLFHLSQHLLRIIRCLYLIVGADDDAVLIDEIGGADHAHGHLPVILLFLPHIIGLDDRPLRIGKQSERKAVFLLKPLWEATESLLTPSITAPFSINCG